MQSPSVVLVTGAAGFIGSNFINRYSEKFPQTKFLVVDKLSYAGNLANLRPSAARDNVSFYHADINDSTTINAIFEANNPDWLIHFAAESHVDRSISGPKAFIESNILGTFELLEACRRHWTSTEGKVFHHVSTDEVYGSLGPTGLFTETTPYDPSSPYSASKASSDHLVRAYGRTFGVPIKVTNCSNNYGPYQFPEKLIPVMVLNALNGKPLPVYGTGENVRDWLFVDDHCDAIWTVAERGKVGETYNVGGESEQTNIQVVNAICRIVAEETNTPIEEKLALITYIQDRPGHDHRYAIDITKINRELGWKPSESFDTGLRKTVRWYLANQDWIQNIQSGDYRSIHSLDAVR